jgi:endonuclease III
VQRGPQWLSLIVVVLVVVAVHGASCGDGDGGASCPSPWPFFARLLEKSQTIRRIVKDCRALPRLIGALLQAHCTGPIRRTEDPRKSRKGEAARSIGAHVPDISARCHRPAGSSPREAEAAKADRPPWLLVLWENVAYLADDDRRAQAFRVLQREVGTRPEQILAAPEETLLAVTGHGIVAEQFAAKLRSCAQLVLQEFDGNLRQVLHWPLAQARKALQKFPGIGEPGAEKILLFTGTAPLFALESNGLRVLLRLGFGEEKKSYSTTYRLVQNDVAPELEEDCAWLIRAHQLLRRHGQELCRRTEPACGDCPLAAECFHHRPARSAP